MSIERQIVIYVIGGLLTLLFLRDFIRGIKFYQLNKSAYKKRKEGATFKDWLLYSGYKEEIPKIIRVLYFAFLTIHPAGIIVGLFVPLNIGGKIARTIWWLNCLLVIVINFLFWTPKGPYKYERWISKRRGQKPKQKKK